MEDDRVEEIHKASTSKTQNSGGDTVSEGESVANSHDSCASNCFALTDAPDEEPRMVSKPRNPVRSCRYCGHRCCLLRSVSKLEPKRKKFFEKKKKSRQRRVKKKIQKKKLTTKRTSKLVQAGSRNPLLSSLCLTNTADQNCQCKQEKHCEVTPDMLYRALVTLTKWKNTTTTEDIMGQLRRSFPVNPNKKQLLNEIREKLKIAVIVDIVVAHGGDTWSLNSALQKRGLAPTHVTMFWQIYGDTMKPVDRKTSEHETPAGDLNVDDPPNAKQCNAAEYQYFT